MLLNYSDHYNKEQNKCFLLARLQEDNSALQPGSWTNEMMLWHIYENAQYGEVVETRRRSFKPDSSREEVVSCNVLYKPCASVNEFEELVRNYMSR